MIFYVSIGPEEFHIRGPWIRIKTYVRLKSNLMQFIRSSSIMKMDLFIDRKITTENIRWNLGGPVVRPLAAHAKGLKFDSPITQHVQRLISRAFTYGSVGSLVLSWFWARKPGFISFRCLWIQLCNILGQRLCAYRIQLCNNIWQWYYVRTSLLSSPSYSSFQGR